MRRRTAGTYEKEDCRDPGEEGLKGPRGMRAAVTQGKRAAGTQGLENLRDPWAGENRGVRGL